MIGAFISLVGAFFTCDKNSFPVVTMLFFVVSELYKIRKALVGKW